jgi:hypothetical protein
MKLSPFQVFNQYSFFVSVVLVAAIGGALLLWRNAGPLWWIGLVVVLVAMIGFALSSRVQQPAVVKLDTVENIRNTIRKSGKPSLVEFYSNY